MAMILNLSMSKVWSVCCLKRIYLPGSIACTYWSSSKMANFIVFWFLGCIAKQNVRDSIALIPRGFTIRHGGICDSVGLF